MAYQACPNCTKVEMNYLQNGIPVVNVFHVNRESDSFDASATAIANEFDAYWQLIKVNLNVSLVLQSIILTDLEVEDGEQLIVPYTTGNTGNVNTAAAAANAACCISLRTGQTGRSFRGRSYVGGINAADLYSAQTLTTTFAGALADHMTDLIAGLTGVGYQLVVLSRWVNNVLRVVGLMTEIIEVIVNTKVDSQRRRTAN